MVETARTGSISQISSAFDDFLFAPIGQESNGMRLSVLSALARLDMDPWQGAAKLAKLPIAGATEQLALWIVNAGLNPHFSGGMLIGVRN